ncbi:hypothetical protein AGLY_015039 [Aphis glycines]|uniref:Uncharacterized protein n=1 Tax=Aphis glycines TaxID=307491 RepID=A0A6G0T340_APHGL|nr:hypothetical protein AGLY_015039 [Aphis glycines]
MHLLYLLSSNKHNLKFFQHYKEFQKYKLLRIISKKFDSCSCSLSPLIMVSEYNRAVKTPIAASLTSSAESSDQTSNFCKAKGIQKSANSSTQVRHRDKLVASSSLLYYKNLSILKSSIKLLGSRSPSIEEITQYKKSGPIKLYSIPTKTIGIKKSKGNFFKTATNALTPFRRMSLSVEVESISFPVFTISKMSFNTCVILSVVYFTIYITADCLTDHNYSTTLSVICIIIEYGDN